jgi:mRNA interferase MazF
VKRGAFVIAAFSGDYGKPRPALVVQSDRFFSLPSLVLCPLTTDLRNAPTFVRIPVQPEASNGLRIISEIAIDKIAVLPLTRIGQVIGHADDDLMERVSQALAEFLAII